MKIIVSKNIIATTTCLLVMSCWAIAQSLTVPVSIKNALDKAFLSHQQRIQKLTPEQQQKNYMLLKQVVEQGRKRVTDSAVIGALAYLDLLLDQALSSIILTKSDLVTPTNDISNTLRQPQQETTTSSLPTSPQDPVSPSLSMPVRNSVTYPQGVDYQKVRDMWLELVNKERRETGRTPYIYDEKLEQTALERAQHSVTRWCTDHARKPSDGYYNHASMEEWFADRGLVYKPINRVTVTESMWRGVYRCSTSGDCTSSILSALNSTYQFFMSEKWKSFQPHYASMVNRSFQRMWVGLALGNNNRNQSIYCLIIHYATEQIN